jgi:hypothetical protein
MRDQSALDDVASNICPALFGGRGGGAPGQGYARYEFKEQAGPYSIDSPIAMRSLDLGVY